MFVQAGVSASSPHGSNAAAAAVVEIERLLAAGQVFRAIDAARAAQATHPDHLHLRLLAALAWLRGDAVGEARAVLAAVADRLESRETRLIRLFEALRALRPHLESERPTPDAAALAQVEQVVRAFAPASMGAADAGSADRTSLMPETFELLADLTAELWRKSRDPGDLRRAFECAQAREAVSEVLTSGGPTVPARAAVLSWHLGDRERARTLARQALERPLPVLPPTETGRSADGSRLRHQRARIEAALLLEDLSRAEAALDEVGAALTCDPAGRSAFRHDLVSLAAAGVPVPDRLLARLPPPVIAICAGQSLDAPGRVPPLFPPCLEDAVADAIAAALAALGVEIAYVGAGAGAEILFIEALLRRGAEVNVMLPCDPDDFVAARVRPAGAVWERRHRQALRLADTVTVVTEDRYTGDDTLIRFANQVIDGSARLRAELLGTDPYLVAAGDLADAADTGGPADFIDNWGDPGRLRLIHLDRIRDARANVVPPAPSVVPPAPDPEPPSRADRPVHRVRTLLFADVVGFTGLAEEHLPAFWRCMEAVSDVLAANREKARPVLMESWGDALFVVMDTAAALADYAFALLRAVDGIDGRAAGLPGAVRFRIGLHAGPVASGTHPLTGRPMVIGRHVSRGARIEAIGVPGQVYASQQFVALLTAETSAARTEARMRGQPYHQRYRAAYLGLLDLPKAFGSQAIYHLSETVGLP